MTSSDHRGIAVVNPVCTSAYAAAVDALDVALADIPATIEAAAGLLRGLLDRLGSWGRGWVYDQRDNWPHAGFVRVDDGNRVVADVHATTGAGGYLAVMGPPLGRAVADWLDAAAVREREHQTANAAGTDLDDADSWGCIDAPEPGDEVFVALVVATTIMQAAALQPTAGPSRTGTGRASNADTLRRTGPPGGTQ